MFFQRSRPLFIDYAALADGRVVRLMELGFFRGTIFVPLSATAPAANPVAERARAAYDQLRAVRELRVKTSVDLDTDDRLIATAVRHGARIISDRPELRQSAAARPGLTVLLIDEIFESMRPVYHAGDQVAARLLKRGKNANEAVGYLRDGTKIVVENGAELVGRTVELVITSMIDVPSGRVAFARSRR